MPATAVYFEDVTQNVKMMHLESRLIQQKNEAINLESYTSMMSHEFRTPLGTAIMFIDLVLQMIQGAEAIKLINLVKSSLNLLLSLVNDMVDLKLIKEDQFSTNQNVFDPLETLDFVRQMFHYQAEANSIELAIKTIPAQYIDNRQAIRWYERLVEKDLPSQLKGDELRLKQVLINLVKNALKFTRRGYIHILAGFDEQLALFKIQVRDSGCGIAKEEIPKLCNKFGKLFRTAELNHEGIGLGLMISKQIIEKNAGELDIFSNGINLGSVFTFSMKMTQRTILPIDNDLNESLEYEEKAQENS